MVDRGTVMDSNHLGGGGRYGWRGEEGKGEGGREEEKMKERRSKGDGRKEKGGKVILPNLLDCNARLN